MSQEAVVEAVWHRGGIAAGHQRVTGGDEIAAVEALAGRLDLADVLVTADSLHSHERLARKIRARGGHWLFVIKLNQPTVHANLTRLPWNQIPDLVTTSEKGHGRTEVRSLKALTITTPGLVGFWGTKQVVQLRRRTRRKKTVTAEPTWSEEVFYLVTNGDRTQASMTVTQRALQPLRHDPAPADGRFHAVAHSGGRLAAEPGIVLSDGVNVFTVAAGPHRGRRSPRSGHCPDAHGPPVRQGLPGRLALPRLEYAAHSVDVRRLGAGLLLQRRRLAFA